MVKKKELKNNYSLNDLSVDSEDNNKDLDSFCKFIEDHTFRKKNVVAKEIELMGNTYLKEIDRKKKKDIFKKNKLIPYILKNSNNTYTKEELLSYSFKDVNDIYSEIKDRNKPFLLKIIHFLFNL